MTYCNARHTVERFLVTAHSVFPLLCTCSGTYLHGRLLQGRLPVLSLPYGYIGSTVQSATDSEVWEVCAVTFFTLYTWFGARYHVYMAVEITATTY